MSGVGALELLLTHESFMGPGLLLVRSPVMPVMITPYILTLMMMAKPIKHSVSKNLKPATLPILWMTDIAPWSMFGVSMMMPPKAIPLHYN